MAAVSVLDREMYSEAESARYLRVPQSENAERNTDFVKNYFDNPDFAAMVKEAARKRAYRIITEPVRDEALAKLRSEMDRETGR